MTQILLHKQTLSAKQIEKLASEGVIAIQTEKPEDFKFLDLSVPQIEINDMVWALLDAANSDNTYSTDVQRKLIDNLATLATEKRAKSKSEIPGKGPIPSALATEPESADNKS
jgi:hypothetical protein